jgi:hypothetical protein
MFKKIHFSIHISLCNNSFNVQKILPKREIFILFACKSILKSIGGKGMSALGRRGNPFLRLKIY